MIKKDPLHHAEKFIKDIHDDVERFSRPVLRRYPLMFAFLIAFSAASILHGFELLVDQISFFDRHPTVLIVLGVLLLFFTGMLYKSLERMRSVEK